MFEAVFLFAPLLMYFKQEECIAMTHKRPSNPKDRKSRKQKPEEWELKELVKAKSWNGRHSRRPSPSVSGDAGKEVPDDGA